LETGTDAETSAGEADQLTKAAASERGDSCCQHGGPTQAYWALTICIRRRADKTGTTEKLPA